MRRTRIIAALLGELLLILSACGSPATTTTTTPAPVAVPASTTPAAAEIAVVPEPAYPLPTPATAPGQWTFVPDLVKYIVEVIPASAQAGFLISRLQVDPEEATVGDNVTFSVVVTNTGGQRGTYTVVLNFDDAVIKTQDVTIDGGGSRKAELNVMAEEHGEFKVMAGQLTAGLRVMF